MIFDEASINELFKYLNTKLNNEYDIHQLHDRVLTKVSQELCAKIQEAQKKLIPTLERKVAGLSKKDKTQYETDKENMLESINQLIKSLTNCISSIRATYFHYNSCQNFSTLLGLALEKDMGKQLKVEYIGIHCRENRNLNHMFVAVDRQGKLDDIESWGTCLILDAHQNWYGTVANIPNELSLSTFKKIKQNNPYKIFNNNLFDINFLLLEKYKNEPNHILHEMERKTLEVMKLSLNDAIEKAHEKFSDRPILKLASRPLSPRASNSMFSLSKKDSVETSPTQNKVVPHSMTYLR